MLLGGSLTGSGLASSLIYPRTTCGGNVAAHSGLSPPTLISHQDNTHGRTRLQANLTWEIFQLEFPSLKVLACVKLTVKAHPTDLNKT